MNYSDEIADFLNFIRDVLQDYSTAKIKEEESNNKTQDLLHRLELYNDNYQNITEISIKLQKIRQERREAKDIRIKTEPIVNWISDNDKILKNLERLLGDVRKIEKAIENRYYAPKTDIISETLGVK